VTTSPLRARAAIFLVALAVIVFELTLIRILALRWWHHLAHMVIGVALLGFGVSGTFLATVRRKVERDVSGWLAYLSLGLACSVPLTALVAERLPLEVAFLAWSLRGELWRIGLLEAALFVPFLVGGCALGVALLDSPERLGGHYAANLVGSGLGAVAAVALMWPLDERGLVAVSAGCAWLAGALLHARDGAARLISIAGTAIATALLIFTLPSEPALSPYKMLAQARLAPGIRTLARARGPLGHIEVVAAPALHYAPGLSLRCTVPIPPHALMILNGDQTSAIYDARERADWAFMDWTTSAAAYALRRRPSVLVIGAGGGADVGLALLHDSPRVVALEMNPQVIALMRGPLASRGGNIYKRPEVEVVAREARGYLAHGRDRFDVIQFPPLDAFGASGAGLLGAQESYLYTVESIEAMLDRLTSDGVLSMTRWAKTPPRDELRLFGMAIEALRHRRLDPSPRLAMIRSWATVTILVSPREFTPAERKALRGFCRSRGFDLCWLSDMRPDEANWFHVLERPYYFDAARALLGTHEANLIRDYLFDISPVTDDRPYFFHSFRWRAWTHIRRQLAGQAPAFLEVGYVLLLAALLQAAVLSVCLIFAPLILRRGGARGMPHAGRWLGYFAAIGVGFMVLEIGFIQRLILYLAHPTYAAAASIAGFLVFAGVGSGTLRAGSSHAGRRASVTAIGLAGLALVYLMGLDRWLAITQGMALPWRMLIALATIAPLGFLMGRLFPLGLDEVERMGPSLVPWAWAVNGSASVIATLATPLVAMRIGFANTMMIAVAAYFLAGLAGRTRSSRAAQAGCGRERFAPGSVEACPSGWGVRGQLASEVREG